VSELASRLLVVEVTATLGLPLRPWVRSPLPRGLGVTVVIKSTDVLLAADQA
jgi:hypothetical protein